jgi:carbonic anhydrase
MDRDHDARTVERCRRAVPIVSVRGMPSPGSDAPLDRRRFLRLTGGAAAAAGVASFLATLDPALGLAGAATAMKSTRPPTPKAAIDALLAGNRRFTSGKSTHPNRSKERRAETASKQQPFAAVLTCSDSRVAPEVIFDRGLGDLFVVRVAGNIAGPDEMASLAYAAEHAHVDAIMVLGHERCGAIEAAIAVAEGKADPGEYRVLTDALGPAVTTAMGLGATGPALVEAAVVENVRRVTAQVPERSAIIRDEIDHRDITVVGAVYQLKSGRVKLVP